MFDIGDEGYERCDCCSEVTYKVYVIGDLGLFCKECNDEIRAHLQQQVCFLPLV